MAQIILLAISYLHRSDIEIVRKLSKSGLFLQCVSNRLAASVPRARVLGMTVATAVSRLVDPADKVMNFGSEEMEEESVQNMLSLVHVNDKVGKIQELTTQHQLKDIPVVEEMIEELEQPRKKKTFKKATPKPQSSKIISIEEVDDEEDEEDDLIPYNKPEDDPSDSDDDPTLINRSKPSAPVYIIDLIRQLQTDDKPEVLELALQTAPELIRRKATFGTELSDNVQVLASTLLNLKRPHIRLNNAFPAPLLSHRLPRLRALNNRPLALLYLLRSRPNTDPTRHNPHRPRTRRTLSIRPRRLYYHHANPFKPPILPLKATPSQPPRPIHPHHNPRQHPHKHHPPTPRRQSRRHPNRTQHPQNPHLLLPPRRPTRRHRKSSRTLQTHPQEPPRSPLLLNLPPTLPPSHPRPLLQQLLLALYPLRSQHPPPPAANPNYNTPHPRSTRPTTPGYNARNPHFTHLPPQPDQLINRRTHPACPPTTPPHDHRSQRRSRKGS